MSDIRASRNGSQREVFFVPAALLRVGTWRVPISAPREIKIIIAPDSNFRFRFITYKPAFPIWDGGPAGLFEPFTFEPKPFHVHTLRVIPKGDSPKQPSLVVTGRPQDSLVMNKVYTGSDELLVDYSGEGMVQQDGKFVTIDLLDRLKKYPILAAIFAMANTAILGWFVFILRGIHRGSK
jgi:hypothetical protein